MTAHPSRPLSTHVEYTELGQVGERSLRGVVERRELHLGPFVIGRTRPRAVDVFEPGLGHRSIRIEAPPGPFLRAGLWVVMVAAGGWLVTMLAGRGHTRR